jgi:hypothetical protein
MLHVFSGHRLAYEDHPDISAADPDANWPWETTSADEDLLIGEGSNVGWQIKGINGNPTTNLIVVTYPIFL